MAGGIPLVRAWNCLQLYADKVLAPLGIGVHESSGLPQHA
jgi:hypothetical protein